MHFPLLQALQYIGLAALLGGPAFWYLIFRPAMQEATGAAARPMTSLVAALTRRIRWGVAFGMIAFAGAQVVEVVLRASEIIGTLDFEELRRLIHASFGFKMTLFRALAGIIFGIAALWLPRLWIGLAVVGLVVAAAYSQTGHTFGVALDVPLMYIVDVIHVLANALWGGGLIYFALLPWRTLREEHYDLLGRITRRFSALGMLAVVTLAATGMYMGSQLVYSLAAVPSTPYGQSLILKISLFVGAIVAAMVNRYVFLERLESPERRVNPGLIEWFGRVVRIESVILLAILVTTGFLTNRTPPRTPISIGETVVEAGRVGALQYDLRIEPREDGYISLYVRLQDEEGAAARGAQITATFDMPSHRMEPQRVTLREEAAGAYTGTVMLPMAGAYRAEFYVQHDGRDQGRFYANLGATLGVREVVLDQMTVRISSERLFYSIGGIPLLLGYLAVIVVGVWLFRRQALRKQSDLLLLLAVLLIVGGAWGVGSMVQVKGFPTTYVRNPVPRTAETIEQGRELFEANCMMCHGPKGRGDGPMGRDFQPPASDLTQMMTQMHTDGDFFWLISNGVPRTAMPAFDSVLSEEERWKIIHYLRELGRARIREEM